MTELDLYDILQGQVAAFLLVLTRTSGIFFISPFFGSMNVSNRLRAGAAVIFAMILFPVVVKESVIQAPDTLLLFAFTVAKEIFIGWLIGLVAYMTLVAVNMAGKIMDMQVGFAVVNMMDPTTMQQSGLIGTFLYNLTIIYFLITNGHHVIISALAESFRLVPLNAMIWNQSLPELINDLTAGIFLNGMKIAMPVTFAILLTNVGLGILARTMPQMNIFVVGIPMQLMIGTSMISMVLPFYILFLDVIFNEMYATISIALKLLGG
ncbi:MAG: flagellar biosynthetic protein FliR [Selenomonadaceae bacterium]|nr:flagellar biosynthetic protein FliR [Selenomonadaceae bacterium]